MAIGGSTNAVVHLLAIAGRLGMPLPLEKFDEFRGRRRSSSTCGPSGKYQMEDLFEAGGIPAVMKELAAAAAPRRLTVTGRTVGENVGDASAGTADVIRPARRAAGRRRRHRDPARQLCPDGAVIKQSAASPTCSKHRGRAVVFNQEDLKARSTTRTWTVDENSCWSCRTPARRRPGMPEWGKIADARKKLLEAGVATWFASPTPA